MDTIIPITDEMVEAGARALALKATIAVTDTETTLYWEANGPEFKEAEAMTRACLEAALAVGGRE